MKYILINSENVWQDLIWSETRTLKRVRCLDCLSACDAIVLDFSMFSVGRPWLAGADYVLVQVFSLVF